VDFSKIITGEDSTIENGICNTFQTNSSMTCFLDSLPGHATVTGSLDYAPNSSGSMTIKIYATSDELQSNQTDAATTLSVSAKDSGSSNSSSSGGGGGGGNIGLMALTLLYSTLIGRYFLRRKSVANPF
jgi:hypothetical protein